MEGQNIRKMMVSIGGFKMSMILAGMWSFSIVVAQQQLAIEAEGILSVSNSINPDSASTGTIRWTGYVFQGWTGPNWKNLNSGVVLDVDGHRYQTIKLGQQEWMVDNLRTTRYQNGAIISNFTDDPSWQSAAVGAWCWYNNDDNFDIPYGKLYNWHAVEDSRGLCPSGWHVPSSDEWNVLGDFLGGAITAGGKMKETGSLYWNNPNTGATNESGLTGLPGGFRRTDGSFDGIGISGIYWSSTQSGGTAAIERDLENTDDHLDMDIAEKTLGHSVRCVKQ